MPSEPSSENPFEVSSVEGDVGSGQPKMPSAAASCGIAIAVLLSSVIAFFATCTAGGIVGMNVGWAVGIDEYHVEFGVLIGILLGALASIFVARYVSRRLQSKGPS